MRGSGKIKTKNELWSDAFNKFFTNLNSVKSIWKHGSCTYILQKTASFYRFLLPLQVNLRLKFLSKNSDVLYKIVDNFSFRPPISILFVASETQKPPLSGTRYFVSFGAVSADKSIKECEHFMPILFVGPLQGRRRIWLVESWRDAY